MGQGFFYVITIEQMRAARGLLGWSQSELASRAGLSLPTVKRVEAGSGPRVSDEARRRIQQALEIGGVQFIAENGGGPGVRLRKRPRQRAAKGWVFRLPVSKIFPDTSRGRRVSSPEKRAQARPLVRSSDFASVERTSRQCSHRATL